MNIKSDKFPLQSEDDMMDPKVAKLLERWNTLHKEGLFSAHDIREYWRTQVPEIYSPTVCEFFFL